MNIIVKDKSTGSYSEIPYPNIDNVELEGLTDQYNLYTITHEERPDINENIGYLVDDIQFTEKKDDDYPFLLKAVKGFKVITHSHEEIITRLNESIGQYIENNYPLWKQTRDQWRIINNDERADYYKSLFQWADRLRAERDSRENDYIQNNIFPSFEWEPKPEKQ